MDPSARIPYRSASSAGSNPDRKAGAHPCNYREELVWAGSESEWESALAEGARAELVPGTGPAGWAAAAEGKPEGELAFAVAARNLAVKGLAMAVAANMVVADSARPGFLVGIGTRMGCALSYSGPWMLL
jgi:hypothetical protein